MVYEFAKYPDETLVVFSDIRKMERKIWQWRGKILLLISIAKSSHFFNKSKKIKKMKNW